MTFGREVSSSIEHDQASFNRKHPARNRKGKKGKMKSPKKPIKIINCPENYLMMKKIGRDVSLYTLSLQLFYPSPRKMLFKVENANVKANFFLNSSTSLIDLLSVTRDASYKMGLSCWCWEHLHTCAIDIENLLQLVLLWISQKM